MTHKKPLLSFASNRGPFALAAVVVVAGAALLTDRTITAQPTGGGQAWQYGELRLFGLDAVFITDGRAWFMEGPARREQIAADGKQEIRVQPPRDLRHINALAEAGWELVPVHRTGDGRETYLLRRPR